MVYSGADRPCCRGVDTTFPSKYQSITPARQSDTTWDIWKVETVYTNNTAGSSTAGVDEIRKGELPNIKF